MFLHMYPRVGGGIHGVIQRYRCITCTHIMILESPDLVLVTDSGQLMYNAVVLLQVL